MRTIETWMRGTQWATVVMGAAVGLLFTIAPTPAKAQPLVPICGDLENMANLVSEQLLGELDDEFDVNLDNEDLCTTLTKNFVKTCKQAVKDSAKCWEKIYASMTKQDKSSCKALAGSDADDCVAYYKDQQQGANEEIDLVAEGETQDCEETVAEDFFDICMFGF